MCPIKYRRVAFDDAVDQELKTICLEIKQRFEIKFLEVRTDKDHVHFLVQSVPTYSPRKVAQTIKSISALEVFKRKPEVKKILRGAEFWSKGYFISTGGKQAGEQAMKNYVKNQTNGKHYKVLHQQLSLW